MAIATHVIKRPLITEKSSWEGAARNRYAFVVDIHATKSQIKTAIAEIYKVRVQKVSTQIRMGKNFRTRTGTSTTGDFKKAVVQLHPDDKLDLI
jgi:large subunit ribosomal protein L23